MQPGDLRWPRMYPCANSRRWIPAAVAASRTVVFCLLLGWGIMRPVGGQAQTGYGWSPPTILYDGMVNTSRTALISDPFGAAHLVWSPGDEQTYYYSRWDGTGWTMPIDILAATGDLGLGPPALVAAADGSLHLFCARDYVMHSWAWNDDTASSARAWSAPEAIVVPSGSAQGRVDAKEDRFGALHLVYAVRSGDVYYVHSEGEDLNWSEPVAVSRGAVATTASAPRLDIGPYGRIHVIWDEWSSDGDPAESSAVYYAHTTAGGTDWSEPRQLGELANRGGNVLAAEDGTVYLAWQAGISSPNVGRFVQRSTDGGNTWEAPVNFSQVNGQSGYPCMALDSQKTLHIITGDGEYVFWDGRLISTPWGLRPLPEQTENARLTVVNGNQLLVVIGPFWSPGLYYTVRQLSLPALPAVTLPARPPAAATPSPAATAEGTPSIEAPMATAAVQNGGALPAGGAASSTMPTLVLSVGLPLALVAGVVIVQLRRRHS